MPPSDGIVTEQRRSRRSLLAGAGIGAAALAAQTLGRVSAADATQDQPVIAGQPNTATDETVLSVTGNGRTAIRGVALESDPSSGSEHYGIEGDAPGSSGIGVIGYGDYEGGEFHGLFGVRAISENPKFMAGTAAVKASANNGGSGLITSGRYGVEAYTDPGFTDGAAVKAVGQVGAAALDVQGPALFSRSGSVRIVWPDKKATVAGAKLSNSSLVLATIQTDVQVWVRAAVPNPLTNSFNIYLNKAPGTSSSPKSVDVAWFIVN